MKEARHKKSKYYNNQFLSSSIKLKIIYDEKNQDSSSLVQGEEYELSGQKHQRNFKDDAKFLNFGKAQVIQI